MAIFAIHYTYPDDVTEMLTIRPEHREWLTGQPGLLVAGMYQDGTDEVSEGEPTDQSRRTPRSSSTRQIRSRPWRRRSTRTPTGSAGTSCDASCASGTRRWGLGSRTRPTPPAESRLISEFVCLPDELTVD